MNIHARITVTVLMVLLSLPARALDGNDLMAGYNSYKRVLAGTAVDSDAYNGGLFDGYVQGVFHSAVGIVICAPGEVKPGQIQEAVGRYLESHQAYRQISAVKLATMALMHTFPCK